MKTTTSEQTGKRPSTQVEDEIKIVKLGLDVHADQITVCRQIGGALPQPAQKMAWKKFLEWVSKQVSAGARVATCYEAGPCGYGLHRQLEALGVQNVVVAPQRWDERRKLVKTDKRDARELVDRLDRWLRGNHNVFATVRVPTPEQEEQRGLARQRGAVLKERNRCVLRGRGMLLCQGIRAPKGWWTARGWESFAPCLPEWLKPRVELWRNQAVRFSDDLVELDRQVRALAARRTIPKGLGELTTALLGAEILDWSRFSNRRQVASYTGLCPSEASSGSSRKQGSINKHGNPRVRHHLVEAIWRLEIWQPQYPPVRKLKEAKGTRARKRLAVAAARRLAIDLWRIETGQCSAAKLGLNLTIPLPTAGAR